MVFQTQNLDEDFKKRFCFHRGDGKENTLESVESAIQRKPFLVEFDVHFEKGRLYMGHPPSIETESTVAEALSLFKHSTVMPKVDLRLKSTTMDTSLYVLTREIAKWSRRIMINVGARGNFSNDPLLQAEPWMTSRFSTFHFMKAEKYIMSHTHRNVLLNIDLHRYSQASPEEIDRHVRHLARHPSCLSPNLDQDIDANIQFALKHKIGLLSMWIHEGDTYEYEYLLSLMQYIRGHGLEVLFDFRPENIIGAHPFIEETVAA
jgi:hypothetical protein